MQSMLIGQVNPPCAHRDPLNHRINFNATSTFRKRTSESWSGSYGALRDNLAWYHHARENLRAVPGVGPKLGARRVSRRHYATV